jgi:hypothetical protein
VTFTNGGFETPGAAAGSALGWVPRAKASLRLFCGFRSADADVAIAAPNDLSGGTWTATQAPVLADAAVAPDGTTTASRVRDSLVAGEHNVALTTPRSFEEGKTYTFSAFVQAGTRTMMGLALDTGSGVGIVTFGLTAGDVEFLSDPIAGKVSAWSAESVTLPDDWFLLSLSWTAEETFSGTPRVTHINGLTTGTTSYAGTIQHFYVWGVSLFEGELHDAEGFDWDDAGGLAIAEADRVAATWDDGTETPASVEGFERAWPFTSSGYLLTISGGEACQFENAEPPLTGIPAAVEAFELGWATTSWAETIPTRVFALFDGATGATEEVEDFEEGWFDNESWVDAGVLSACDFDSTPGTPEQDFENVLRDVQVAAASGPNTFTATAHGLVDGDTVYWRTIGGDRPAPLVHTLVYYVVSAAADTFQLSLTAGGGAIDITTDGTGEHFVRGDPARFWNELDYNESLD